MTSRLFLVVPAIVIAVGLASIGVMTQGARLTDTELKRIGSSASTRADHTRLAAHYRAHAAEHEADAAVHEHIAEESRKRASTDDDAWDLARDATHYASHSHEAAEALRELAALHDNL